MKKHFLCPHLAVGLCRHTQRPRPPTATNLGTSESALWGQLWCEGSWIYGYLVLQFGGWVCLMGTFYILGCSASYPPSCLGEPQCVGQSSASQQGDSSRPDILPSRLRVLGHQHTASAWPRGLASGLRATVRQGSRGFSESRVTWRWRES